MTEKLTEQDWQNAKDHLDEVRRLYTEMPVMAGGLALRFVLDPMAARYENGERTRELYDEMMQAE